VRTVTIPTQLAPRPPWCASPIRPPVRSFQVRHTSCAHRRAPCGPPAHCCAGPGPITAAHGIRGPCALLTPGLCMWCDLLCVCVQVNFCLQVCMLHAGRAPCVASRPRRLAAACAPCGGTAMPHPCIIHAQTTPLVIGGWRGVRMCRRARASRCPLLRWARGPLPRYAPPRPVSKLSPMHVGSGGPRVCAATIEHPPAP